MVDWICEACEACGLQRTTGHVACQYLDRVCNQDDVPTHRLALVSLAAIQIAAKYEEKEESVPPLEVLIARSGHPIPERQVHQMEVLMLTAMDWICTAVVPMHFLGLYAARGVVFEEDASSPSMRGRLTGLGKYLDFFADLCCQDYDFEQFRPSSVAGGIVLAARRALGVRDVWTPRLAEVMHAPVSEMSAVFFRVWSNYVAQFGEAAADIDRRYAALAVDSSVEWLFNMALPAHILSIPEDRRAPRHIWDRRKLGTKPSASQFFPAPPVMQPPAGVAAAPLAVVVPAAAPASAPAARLAAASSSVATAATATGSAKRSHSASTTAFAEPEAAASSAASGMSRQPLAETTGSQQQGLKRWSTGFGATAQASTVPTLGMRPSS
jgi:hypothetical protein